MLIVEGPDGSGKSTLVKTLQIMFDIPTVVQWNKPPKTADELAANLKRSKNLVKTPVIQDRIPWITEPIYDTIKNGTKNISTWFYYLTGTALFHSHIVYCRPPNEVIEEHCGEPSSSCDSLEYLKWVSDNYAGLVILYDAFMEQIRPAITYDWTKPNDVKKLEALRGVVDRSKKLAPLRANSRASK